MWSHQMLSVLPQQNLVSNIGFGLEATHTSNVSKLANLPVSPIRFPLLHPTSLTACDEADNRTAGEMFVPRLPKRIISRLRALAQAT
jgi:hypothetical protein